MKQKNVILALFLSGCTLLSACGTGSSPTKNKTAGIGTSNIGSSAIAIKDCSMPNCSITVGGKTINLGDSNTYDNSIQIKTDLSYTGAYLNDNGRGDSYIKFYTAGEKTHNLPTTNQEVTYKGNFKHWGLKINKGLSTKTFTSKTPVGTGTVTVNVNLHQVNQPGAMKFKFVYPATSIPLTGTFKSDGSFTYGTNGTSKGQFYGKNAEEMAGINHSGNSLTIFTAKKQP